MISVVVAISENNVIGKDNTLPWHLSSDLQRFKEITSGNPVILGRKTYESIPKKFRPLPNRTNIILTRNMNFIMGDTPEIKIRHSLEKAIETGKELGGEVFVIGGSQIYEEAITRGLVNKIYLTRVHTEIEGDAGITDFIFFPENDWTDWKEMHKEFHPAGPKDDYDYTFYTYTKN